MKLYTTKLAPNPERVLMFLAEKGVTPEAAGIELVEVSLVKGEHKQAGFTALSPLAHIPALQFNDGRVLTESRAICSYLEGVIPEPNLMGKDSEERAFIEMWDRRMELSLMSAIAHMVRHGHPAMTAVESPQFPEWGQRNGERAEQILLWLDQELAGRAFIAGDRFTICDITAFVSLQFGRLMKYRPWERMPNLARWRTSMFARPTNLHGQQP